MKYAYNDLLRFWNCVEITLPQECWLWKKSLNNKGYGKFSVKHKQIYSHRFAFLYYYGYLTDGLEVCHSCDTTRVVVIPYIYGKGLTVII